jgi:hypothetical protein
MPAHFQGGKIMGLYTVVFAYLGPETMLPMTSVVAGLVGVLMMFGRNSWLWARGIYQRVAPRPKAARRFRRIGTGPVDPVVSRQARVRV